ncbi:hypothetical protein [Streptomyces sp. NPDC048277]|uniref:hypothetical protein n=1 Tax=Streptomyces sp. NPDC048277 TaxID=3155027 RepID=UPI0033FDA0B5
MTVVSAIGLPPKGNRMSLLRLGVSRFDDVAVGNRLLDSGFGLDTDPLVLLSAVAGATTRLRLLTSVLVALES